MGDRSRLILNSSFGVRLAMGLGRWVPPRLGYPLARLIADGISSRKNWAMVRAVRANQWVIHGCRCSPQELDLHVRDEFRHTARCLFDLYRFIHAPADLEMGVVFSARVEEIIRNSRTGDCGQLVAGLHMSNFDFVMQFAAQRGLKALVLSTANPGRGYQMQNEIRRQSGIEILPASISSLKAAVNHLRAGGTVLTGLDRPLPSSDYHPLFFDHPSNLPVFYIQVALLARVPVIVSSAILDDQGVYHIRASEPVAARNFSDKRKEILDYAGRVLDVAADYIRQAPHQWSLTYPVWPEVMDLVP